MSEEHAGSLHSLFLPTSQQTALLKSCLYDGEDGRLAWIDWQENHGGPRSVLSGGRDGAKRLLPMLAETLGRQHVDIDPVAATCLRTAYTREAFRWKTFSGICKVALAGLHEEGIRFIVLKGAALAETEYGDPALRHCHDCDLLVKAEDQLRAAKTLEPLGFKVFNRSERRGRNRTILVHETGLPIQMHEQPWEIPYYNAPIESIWRRAIPREIFGVPAVVLSPADTLLHVCVQSTCTHIRSTLVWACDAWKVIDSHCSIDWDALVDTAIASKAVLPASITLHYLAEELHAPVPAYTLERLEEAASKTGGAALEAAFFGASAGPHGSMSALAGVCTSWRERLAFVKWMFAPSPSLVRWAYRVDKTSSLWKYYLYRPLHGVLRRFNLKWLDRDELAMPEFMVGAPPADAEQRAAA